MPRPYPGRDVGAEHARPDAYKIAGHPSAAGVAETRMIMSVGKTAPSGCGSAKISATDRGHGSKPRAKLAVSRLMLNATFLN
jgi:hypothetical protein